MPPEVKHYYNSDKCWLDDLTLYSGLQNVNVNQYILSANATFLDYEFASEGVKGKITKRIQFRKVNDNPSVYNLSLGDFEPTTGTVSDITTTNNKDTDMVLRTVAAAVIFSPLSRRVRDGRRKYAVACKAISHAGICQPQ